MGVRLVGKNMLILSPEDDVIKMQERIDDLLEEILSLKEENEQLKERQE